MPYKTNEDLPERVKDNIPTHAQDIFREAFNSAEEQYKEEETAYQVAWSAVKKEYSKNKEGKWVKKEDEK